MLRTRQIIYLIKRFKHGKDHWSMQHKKRQTKDKALEHFDDFYGSVFGNRWKSIRIALLCEHKYVALVNNFGDTETTIRDLEMNGAINVRSIYNASKENIKFKKSLQDQNQSTGPGLLDQKVDRFFKRQQLDEMSSVYPDNSPPINSNSNIEDLKNEPVDYKKPLGKSLEEDSEIDQSRLIDASLGTSGLYEYVPATKLKGMEDWVLESDHYKYYSTTTDFPLKIEDETEFGIPENLHLFTYEKGNVSTFIKPRPCLTGVNSHYLMAGASILPPLMLDIKPGERVLDACAAPGGKSLLMLQSLHPEMLVANDVMESRVNRLRKVFYEFLYDFDENWNKKRCILTQEDARNIQEYGMYDKILVDVPCTNDRHSVMENDNNIFKPGRVKERLRIPELQAAILTNCLQLLKPGGSLVYSTCSLSPVQNDGVVHMALSKLFTDYSITTTIKNLSHIIQPFSTIFHFENPKNLKYGQLVLPILYANFGPMYLCKITRNL